MFIWILWCHQQQLSVRPAGTKNKYARYPDSWRIFSAKKKKQFNNNLKLEFRACERSGIAFRETCYCLFLFFFHFVHFIYLNWSHRNWAYTAAEAPDHGLCYVWHSMLFQLFNELSPAHAKRWNISCFLFCSHTCVFVCIKRMEKIERLSHERKKYTRVLLGDFAWCILRTHS